MGQQTYDLVVIGSGTGGYSCAIRASELSMNVALVERDGLGGTCLLRGCIPTKALLYAAEVLDSGRAASEFGIFFGEPRVDWPKVQEAKTSTVRHLTRGLEGLLVRRKISIVKGTGRLAGSGKVLVSTEEGEKTLLARDVVIATGSAPKSIPLARIDGKRIVTSDELLEIERIPSSLAIIGGGYIGCEFASMFNSFGSKVTIIEVLPDLLAPSDREIRERLPSAFEKRGIELRLGTRITAIDVSKEGVSIELEDKPPVEADVLLVATGRRPMTGELGLDSVGARVDQRGYVEINEDYLAAPGVYAIGDCIPTLGLAHVSFAEGYYVAEKIAGGNPLRPDYDSVPQIVYSFPEVASVGITEDEAVARGLDVVIARFPFRANSRAVTMKESEGFAKIIALKDRGPIVGVHLIGSHVAELATEAMLAVNWEASAGEVGILHHPHPTLSEVIGEAALKLAGMPLHSP